MRHYIVTLIFAARSVAIDAIASDPFRAIVTATQGGDAPRSIVCRVAA